MTTAPKTAEHPFCRSSHEEATSLLAVRPGLEVCDALERASCYVSAVRDALEELAEKGNESGLHWSLSYTLDTANALLQSAIGGTSTDTPVASHVA